MCIFYAQSGFIAIVLPDKLAAIRYIQAWACILQIGKNNNPVVFTECGIHAREWISPAVCLKIITSVRNAIVVFSSISSRSCLNVD